MDDTFSLNNLEQALSQLGDKGVEIFKKIKESVADSSESTIKWSEVVKHVSPDIAASLHKILEKSQDLISSFFTMTEVGKETMGAINSVGSAVKNMFADSDVGVSTFVMGMLDAKGLLDQNITGMGRLGDAGYEAGSKISTAFKSVEPIIKAAFQHQGLTNLNKSIIEGTSRVIGLEREILNMATAQGTASKYFDEADHKVKGLTQAYQDYVAMSVSVARATGQTVGTAMELNKALASIPKALDDGDNAVKTSRLAAASGREQLLVAQQLSEMYTRLGTNVKDATEAVAYMQDKGGDSKLRMEAFNQTVMTIAGSFKMLGDNTLATTNFVKSFDKAFEDSKISPEAMKEVITSIGEGVSRMDVAKKAFVSGATGGPGGLAGAAQMDYAIQTGHADEVIKKTMLAMQSQFGGQVVTLKDAAQNPSLAGEFYKQIQYLTQVAGIAKDEDQAKRILEAMKSGVMDIMKPGAGLEEKDLSLTRQLDKGANIQSQTQTTLMGMHQLLEEARLKQDLFYQNQFANVDKNIGSIAAKMGLGGIEAPPQEVGSGAGSASSTGMSGTAGNASYILPRSGDVGGNDMSMSNTIHNLRLSLGRDIGTIPEQKTTTANIARNREVAEHHMLRQRPGTEAGISEIAPGHMPKVGAPDLPQLQLPSAAKAGEGDIRALESKPQELNVTVKIDVDQASVLRAVKAQIDRDDADRRASRTHGRSL